MKTLSILTIHHHHLLLPSPHVILDKIHDIKISGAFQRTAHLALSATLAAALFTMLFSICVRLHDSKIVASYLEASPRIVYMNIE